VTVLALEHPHLAALLGDTTIARAFEAGAEVRAMLAFEAALARAEAAVGLIPADAAEPIARAAARFVPDHEVLSRGAARDGLIVPALVRVLKEAVGAPHDACVHKGATSQDVIDTGLTVRLKDVVATLHQRLVDLVGRLENAAAHAGDKPLMGRTRMQAALPITLAHRLRQWAAGLAEARDRLDELAPRLLVVQLGGAVGTRTDYGPQADEIERRIAADLGLGVASAPWHTNRARIVEFGDLLGRMAGAAGKIGQDVVLMAQNEMAEATLAVAGTSSVMGHKRNPVKAEVLVTLARFAAGLVGTLHQSLVHEGERSGTAWTLEWLVLPQLAVAAGASLRLTGEVLDETTF
jgi:3-carboxy-cis,cis-muconate cycloisomerase